MGGNGVVVVVVAAAAVRWIDRSAQRFGSTNRDVISLEIDTRKLEGKE